MAEEHLTVSLHGEEIGAIAHRNGLASFEFFDSYVDEPRRSVLGQKFEEDLRGRWRQQGRSPVWFSNLLPEDGLLRDFLIGELNLKPSAELDLLLALGQDLPGALTVQLSDAPPGGGNRFDRATDEPENTDVTRGVRFSAAGIQLKLSMIRDRNSIRLPGEGELGRHFVKFAGTLQRVPNNEHAMMRVGKDAGLDVPPIELVPVGSLEGLPDAIQRLKGAHAYVIERFDRTASGQRVHIEDLNQVLGQWPERKYEGASYDGLGRLVRAVCGLDDFWEYFDRLIFMVLVGNEDAHLKNWSLIYRDGRTPRLSPMYDVVSTVVIPGLERGMALNFAGDKRPQAIDRASIAAFAKGVGVDADELEDRAAAFVRKVAEVEAAARSDRSGLTPDEWRALDEYRKTVPFVADLLR